MQVSVNAAQNQPQSLNAEQFTGDKGAIFSVRQSRDYL